MNKGNKKDLKSKNVDHIDRVEETLQVKKEKINTGKVKISKQVIEEDVPIDLTGFDEEIEIERKKIGRLVDKPGPPVRKEGDATVYYLYKEVYVKQTILEEEVRISKKTTQKSYKGKEKLRKEVLNVDRTTKPSEEKK